MYFLSTFPTIRVHALTSQYRDACLLQFTVTMSILVMQCELDHDNEVTCVDLDCDALKVASGTVDGK